MTLSVPIKRGSSHNVPIDEIEIDYSRRWVAIHTRSIVAAYSNSPYFDFYADDILGIIGSMTPKLIDLNMELTEHIKGITGLTTKLTFSKSFTPPYFAEGS
jgi:hypothetical protein